MSISLSLKLNRSDLNDRHQFPQHQHQHQQKQQNRLLFASDDDGNDCDDNELPSLSSERSEIPAQPSSLSLSSSMAIKMNRSSEFNHHSNKSPRRRNLESEINKQLIRSLMPLSFQRSKSSVINQQQQQQSHYPHRHLNYLLKKRECLDNSMRYLFSFGDRRYSLIVQFILILEIFVSFNLIQLNSCKFHSNLIWFHWQNFSEFFAHYCSFSNRLSLNRHQLNLYWFANRKSIQNRLCDQWKKRWWDDEERAR